MADYVWRVTNERIARAVKYNPDIRISEIMRLARVYYTAVQQAIKDGLIVSDGEPIPQFAITEKGEALVK